VSDLRLQLSGKSDECLVTDCLTDGEGGELPHTVFTSGRQTKVRMNSCRDS
jgi:hypothetical protein